MTWGRGFQRITTAVSVAVFVVGGAIVTRETSAVKWFHVHKAAHDAREQQFQAWLTQHPEARPRYTLRIPAGNQVHEFPGAFTDQEIVAALSRSRPGKARWDRKDVALDVYLARVFAESEAIAQARHDHAGRYGLTVESDPMFWLDPPHLWWRWSTAQVALAGWGLVVVASALPWGVFYLGRWMFLGFIDPRNTESAAGKSPEGETR